MDFTIILTIFSAIISLTFGYNNYYSSPTGFDSFRPSQIDYGLSSHNFDSFWKPSVRYVQAPIPTKLFTPAKYPYPAETPGQIEMYNAALKEEAEEAQKESSSDENLVYNPRDHLFNLDDQVFNYRNQQKYNFGHSYVNVKLGGAQNLEYNYKI